ncbi:MAG: hypothetical protein ACK583_08505 [Cyanobacteriota bacterium]
MAQQVEGQPLRCAGADARQPLKLVDQTSEGSGEAAQRIKAGGLNLGGAGWLAVWRENGGQATGAPLPGRPPPAC